MPPFVFREVFECYISNSGKQTQSQRTATLMSITDINFDVTVVGHMLRMGEFATTLNKRVENAVYPQQLLQFHVLQESY